MTKRNFDRLEAGATYRTRGGAEVVVRERSYPFTAGGEPYTPAGDFYTFDQETADDLITKVRNADGSPVEPEFDVSQVESFRIRTMGVRHSTAIQERLFELGFKWAVGSAGVRFTDAYALVARPSGRLTKLDDDSFDRSYYSGMSIREVTLDDLFGSITEEATVKTPSPDDEITITVLDNFAEYGVTCKRSVWEERVRRVQEALDA